MLRSRLGHRPSSSRRKCQIGHLLLHHQYHYRADSKIRMRTDRHARGQNLMRYHRLYLLRSRLGHRPSSWRQNSQSCHLMPRHQYRFQDETKNRMHIHRCARDPRQIHCRHYHMLRSRLCHRPSSSRPTSPSSHLQPRRQCQSQAETKNRMRTRRCVHGLRWMQCHHYHMLRSRLCHRRSS